jgi:hypothetical protein
MQIKSLMVGSGQDEDMTGDNDAILRGQAVDGYEALPSLDAHGEMIRLILVEASLLAEKYRYVSRHDIPHVRELSGLLDVLWQEVEMKSVPALRVG